MQFSVHFTTVGCDIVGNSLWKTWRQTRQRWAGWWPHRRRVMLEIALNVELQLEARVTLIMRGPCGPLAGKCSFSWEFSLTTLHWNVELVYLFLWERPMCRVAACATAKQTVVGTAQWARKRRKQWNHWLEQQTESKNQYLCSIKLNRFDLTCFSLLELLWTRVICQIFKVVD